MKNGYIHLSKSWYGKANLDNRRDGLIDEISVGVVIKGEPVYFHFEYFSSTGIGSPRLGCFSDSWKALAAAPELIKTMGNHSDNNLTPDRLKSMLEDAGFSDLTPTVHPPA